MPYKYPQSRSHRTGLSDYAPFEVRRYGRHWEVRDAAGQLVCLTVYRRGAAEVVRRLKATSELPEIPDRVEPRESMGAVPPQASQPMGGEVEQLAVR